jgi:imidazolonepropionase-like amidohydrolase
MYTLLKNIGNLYTPNQKGRYGEITHMKNVSLAIRDGYIEEIYPEKSPSNDKFTFTIDAKSLTLLPGFIDSHTQLKENPMKK